MALVTLLEAIGARLDGVTVHVGAEHVLKRDKPPRVVFVPARERWGPPGNIGGPQRQLWTRLSTVEVHVWAATHQATEELLETVLQAVHLEAHGSYVVDDGEQGWLRSDMGALTDQGVAYLLRLTFSVPVLDAALASVVVTSIPMTPSVALGGPPPVDTPA